jgi:hypothetical protein
MPAGLVVASLGRRLTVRAVPALRALTAVATCSIVLETQENMDVVKTTETIHNFTFFNADMNILLLS